MDMGSKIIDKTRWIDLSFWRMSSIQIPGITSSIDGMRSFGIKISCKGIVTGF